MKAFKILAIASFLIAAATSSAQTTACGDTILICSGTQETVHFEASNYNLASLQLTVTPAAPFTLNLSDTSMTVTFATAGVYQIRAQANALSPICPPLDCSMFYNVVDLAAVIASPADDCQHAGTLSLLPYGTPAGGTWLINGSPGTSVDLNVPGTYNLTYNITGAGGCSATATGSFTIEPAPVIFGFRRQ